MKEGIIILHMCAKFHVQRNSESRDIGSNGGQKGSKWVKMGFFGILRKTSWTIWFLLLVKEDIIILHRCAKFQVQVNFGSRDIGVKKVKNKGLPYLTKVVINP